MWQHWVNAIVGVWVLLSAFFNFSSSAITTNLIVSGIIVAIVGLWGALQETSYSENRTHSHA